MTDTSSAKVIVYSTPWCAFCKTEKQYLEHLGVAYTNKDIEEDASAYEELMAKVDNQNTGVPVTDIDGVIVRGFDRKRIDEVLREKGLIAPQG
jgi:glutaredoxin-like YruB-family protein